MYNNNDNIDYTNNPIDEILKKIDNNPNELIQTLNNEIMRRDMQLESLEKEKKTAEELIRMSKDPELIEMMEKISSSETSNEENLQLLENMRNSCINDIKKLLIQDKKLIELLSK